MNGEADSEADAIGQVEVARELRRHRQRAGLSLGELARRVGYSRTYISKSEKPGADLVSANVVQRIDEQLAASGELIALHARADAVRQGRRNPVQADPVGHGGSEVVALYPHRNDVSNDLWDHLIAQGVSKIDVLVYVGMFLTEKPGLLATLSSKAEHGGKIRLLFGQRDSPAVVQRSVDEGIGTGTISAKIDHSIAHFGDLAGVPGVEIRTHATVLYNSIYQFDDEMIVNPHIFGRTAPHAPAIHLRRQPTGNLFAAYEDSFDAVWARSSRFEPEQG